MTPGNDATEKVHSSSDSVSSDGEAPPALRITHKRVDTSCDLASLVEMFPQEEPKHNLEYIYDLSNYKFSSTRDCILDGISIESSSRASCFHIIAVSFYKFSKFNPNAQVRISIRKQPGVDTGGI